MVQKLKRSEITSLIDKYGFTIWEPKTLDPKPPNYFIVAKK